jgi:hypothetical protein
LTGDPEVIAWIRAQRKAWSERRTQIVVEPSLYAKLVAHAKATNDVLGADVSQGALVFHGIPIVEASH